MVESLRPDLAAHRGAPDKTPERRLATLEAAGELAIPFTTGILVGIGEGEADRLERLGGHRSQPSTPRPRAGGHRPELPAEARHRHACRRPCPPEDHVRAVALARLGAACRRYTSRHHPTCPKRHTSATCSTPASTTGAAISPVTIDHVNPERPWPAVETLRAATEALGLTLAPRLTVYPEYAADPDRWLDPALRFPVLDRSDAESLGRDDPGATWPERHQAAANVGTGAEVVQIGRRSTAWYSGADTPPPTLLHTGSSASPARGAPMRTLTNRGQSAVGEVLAGVRAGQEPGEVELVTLFGARGPEVADVAGLADELRRDAVGDTVTYVVNRNINYTNVCTFRCTFCGFSKGPLSLNLRGAPYLLSLDDIAERTVQAATRGATEVCLQGGIHPSFDGEFYVDVVRAVKAAVPGMHVHGFTALEVTEGARRLAEPLAAYLTPVQGRRSRLAPRHRRRDPRRRGPRGAVPRQGRHRGVAGGAPHRPRHRPAQQHHDHVRLGRAPGALGPPRHPHPRPPEADGRLHRVRAAAVRAHGGAGVPQARRPARAYLARERPHARRRPDRLPRPGRQHPGVVGQARPRRCQTAAGRGRQRPRRHTHGREHQPGGGRHPRAAGDPRGAARARRLGRTDGRAAHHPVRRRRAACRPRRRSARWVDAPDRLQGQRRAVRPTRAGGARRARRAGGPGQRDDERPPPAMAAHRRPRTQRARLPRRDRRAHRARRARHQRADAELPLQPGGARPAVRHPGPAQPRSHRARGRHRRGAQRGRGRPARVAGLQGTLRPAARGRAA